MQNYTKNNNRQEKNLQRAKKKEKCHSVNAYLAIDCQSFLSFDILAICWASMVHATHKHTVINAKTKYKKTGENTKTKLKKKIINEFVSIQDVNLWTILLAMLLVSILWIFPPFLLLDSVLFSFIYLILLLLCIHAQCTYPNHVSAAVILNTM